MLRDFCLCAVDQLYMTYLLEESGGPHGSMISDGSRGKKARGWRQVLTIIIPEQGWMDASCFCSPEKRPLSRLRNFFFCLKRDENQGGLFVEVAPLDIGDRVRARGRRVRRDRGKT